ncbi:MAG: hypothetical protein Q4B82_07205 [Alysiella sp.]|uniref:hypothetical protein n=1 Tax=Alysiella sp. TaxID=1872483 RepID=UPI0026DBCF74|nr:hypothetical protein [Alysiella sp.]MDO4434348.1 hypothetical protein [Alysiella sp.]
MLTKVFQSGNSLPKCNQLCMSVVSYGKLLKGMFGSQNSEKAHREFVALAKIVPVLPLHEAMPEYYGQWSNILKQRGKPIATTICGLPHTLWL